MYIDFIPPYPPTYAVLTVRINTYNGWPTYLDQTPRAMAMAGFLYAGRMVLVVLVIAGGV
jgi:hypothetical protein